MSDYNKMSEVFELCETNFYKNIRFVQKSLNELTNAANCLDSINEALLEASQEVNKMEIEYSYAKNQGMRDKINLFKEELRTYKRQVLERERKVKEELSANSDELFDSQKEQLAVNPLIQAKRQMYENEDLSNEAAIGIKRNNEKLINNIAKMDQINNELTIAQKILGSIKQKMRKNKLALWGTVLLLVLVAIFVIYTYVK